MPDTLVFIDDGFLSKLSKYFGEGEYIKFDKIVFAENLAKKQNLNCKHIFYYTAPPFQSPVPTEDEKKRKKGHDNFIGKLSAYKNITIRQGRVQRLKIDGNFIYKQKAVDSLAIIDLMKVPLKYPEVKSIIIISSDSDFVPAIDSLKEFCIRAILCTYYEKKRDTNFSRSNELIKSAYKYVLLTKDDFNNASLNKYKNNKAYLK